MNCTESLPNKIEIETLREVDYDDIGDVLGYYCLGHQNKVAFADAVNAEYEPDEPFEASQVKHIFWVERLLDEYEPDCKETYFQPCTEDVEGAFAATCIEF
jgi:hypothetical protein